ncbi:hypothetical protein [Serratia quinivorans]|uniref:hypothetical protein n=1 Tax=Serratia quinivorans TaxID=137545 RepID=UPI0039066CDB
MHCCERSKKNDDKKEGDNECDCCIFKKDICSLISYDYKEDKLENAAKRLQMLVQKGIFVTLTIVLIIKGVCEIAQTFHIFSGRENYQNLKEAMTFFEHILAINTLQYVAKALAVSCGIQLAYMLVTDGPDEAVDPLMLGIASAILLVLSSTTDWDFNHAVAIFLLVITIPLLYLTSKRMKNKNNE